MIVYLVKKPEENSGRFFTTRDEAEKQAGYLNDIPDGVTYMVEKVDLK